MTSIFLPSTKASTKLASLLIAGILFGLFLTTSALGQNHVDQKFQKQLAKVVQRFETQKTSANRYVLKQFDKMRAQIKGDRSISEATRSDLTSRLTRYRKEFEKTQSLPSIAETIELEIAYQEKLSRAFKPINKLLEKELAAANRNDDSGYANELVELKEKLELDLMSSLKINNGSEFSGTLTRPNGATIPYKLRIKDISDSGNFNGTVEDNFGVAGHWRYRVSGVRNGNWIQFSMSENLRGKLIAVKGEGVITGNRLLAVVTQRTNKGRTTENKVVLRR